MPDSSGGTPDAAGRVGPGARPEVVARGRRMARRRARRRATPAFVVAAVVLAAVKLLTGAGTPPQAAVATHGALEIRPMWRPAGDVLTRKLQPSAMQPFAAVWDPGQREAAAARFAEVAAFARRYRIGVDLAGMIYDAAIAEGIEPELGFRLVRVESVFNPRAASPAGAVGLTQLMPSTARSFEPGVTREQLLDPETNLRIGFRYLRTLIRDYKGDLTLALLVYNRGPNAVQTALALGEDPANGYERLLLRGYRGRGVLD